MHFLRLIARLPLRWFHAIGSLLGWIIYWSSPRYAQVMRDNLKQSKLWASQAEYDAMVRQCVAETGRGALELVPVWFRSVEQCAGLIKRFSGLDELITLVRSGRGAIIMTPHLGCFEIAGIGISRHMPFTVLYRRPKMAWLERFIVAGRERGQQRLAPADLTGVRALYRALRKGEAIGLLPDQAPSAGEGVWADFFGRPAYTMTLVSRLLERTDAAAFILSCRRLPHGQGFEIDMTRIDEDLRGEAGAQILNKWVERAIRQCPSQYLWSYRRYKHPAGAPPPPVMQPEEPMA